MGQALAVTCGHKLNLDETGRHIGEGLKGLCNANVLGTQFNIGARNTNLRQTDAMLPEATEG